MLVYRYGVNMDKIEIKQGKNGTKFIRINGDAVMLPVWNTKTGEVADTNALVERIGLCLMLHREHSLEELQALVATNRQ